MNYSWYESIIYYRTILDNESAAGVSSHAPYGRQVELAPATATGFYHMFVAL
jgi:hypothetical protein